MMMTSSNFVSFTRPISFATLSRSDRTSESRVDAEVDTAATGLGRGLSEQELEALKSAAYAEGVEAGRQLERDASGLEAARLNTEYRQSFSSLELARADLVEQVQALLPELVIEGVGRILQAWQPDAEAIEAVVQELLAGFDAAEGDIRVYLHPDSMQQLLAAGDAFRAGNPHLDLQADGALQVGECRVEGRFGLADARYSSKLLNLRKVLIDE